jgi:tRNA U34 5-methylaminomethyl-2-thiouridine-forming methyltransferase MnmC
MDAMPEEEIEPLVAAIRRYGSNTLLFVTLADAGHRSGTVEERAPGFLVGYLDRFAPEEDAQDLLLAPWVRLCREAYRLRLSAACGAPSGT